MQVVSMTFAYNEGFLLPYFLKHYRNMVDEMVFFYDEDSTDDTAKILEKGNFTYYPFKFSDGMDDFAKVKILNVFYRDMATEETIFLNVDCDEFIFADHNDILSLEDGINFVKFANVYRHESEGDLSLKKTIKDQRRHGVYALGYNKPIIIKGKHALEWLPGNHVIKTQARLIDTGIKGAHWANADLSFCLERRIKHRRDRQSQINIHNELSIHNQGITEEDIIEECNNHRNDPQLW